MCVNAPLFAATPKTCNYKFAICKLQEFKLYENGIAGEMVFHHNIENDDNFQHGSHNFIYRKVIK